MIAAMALIRGLQALRRRRAAENAADRHPGLPGEPVPPLLDLPLPAGP